MSQLSPLQKAIAGYSGGYSQLFRTLGSTGAFGCAHYELLQLFSHALFALQWMADHVQLITTNKYLTCIYYIVVTQDKYLLQKITMNFHTVLFFCAVLSLCTRAGIYTKEKERQNSNRKSHLTLLILQHVTMVTMGDHDYWGPV